jgi:NAD(P)-dependent dehydrogenase (short-subunit alcohol dehydrogenase family)
MSHLVIVGGTKGIGKAFADLAKQSYANLTVISRSPPATQPDPRHRHLVADASVPSEFEACLRRAVSDAGKITGLVMFQQYRGKDEPWDRKLSCILGATRTALELGPELFSEHRDKAVVLLTSNATRFACDEQDAGYHAAKTGLLGLCRYYAVKLGPLGIRVNCVSPGTVLKEESRQFILENHDLHERLCSVNALRRLADASEVAAVIRFLISEDASFVTGQEIVVDGGAGVRSQESLARASYFASRSVT